MKNKVTESLSEVEILFKEGKFNNKNVQNIIETVSNIIKSKESTKDDILLLCKTLSKYFNIKSTIVKFSQFIKHLGHSKNIRKNFIYCKIIQNSPIKLKSDIKILSNLIESKYLTFEASKALYHIIKISDDKIDISLKSILINCYKKHKNPILMEIYNFIDPGNTESQILILLPNKDYNSYNSIYKILVNSKIIFETTFIFDKVYTDLIIFTEEYSNNNKEDIKRLLMIKSKILLEIYRRLSGKPKLELDENLLLINPSLIEIYVDQVDSAEKVNSKMVKLMLTSSNLSFINLYFKASSMENKDSLIQMLLNTSQVNTNNLSEEKVVIIIKEIILRIKDSQIEKELFIKNILLFSVEIQIEIFNTLENFYLSSYSSHLVNLAKTGFTHHKTKIRKSTFILISNHFSIFSISQKKSLLNVFWYFCLDLDVINEFDILLEKYSALSENTQNEKLNINWAIYLFSGINHRAIIVRERYSNLYRILYKNSKRELYLDINKLL